MSLLEFQRAVAGGIMAPLSRRTPERLAAKEHIKSNSRMTALERLEVYRRSYWFRILDALTDDFPGLRAVVGSRAFRRLAEAYLSDSPSQSFTMRNLGANLEPWLVAHPEYAGSDFVLAIDMVRLEWAHIEAFDGAAVKPVGPEDLIELSAEMQFSLQPHLTLLELRYPVEDLRIRVQDAAAGEESCEAASNSQPRRKERGIVRQYKKLAPRPAFLGVHRVEFKVFYRPLEEGEFRILQAIRQGLPLGEAVSAAPDSASSIEAWFASWSRMGWLVREKPPGEKEQIND